MDNLQEKVLIMKEQFGDILDACGADYKIALVYDEKENTFGGNPHIKATFSGVINGIPYKTKVFNYQMHAQTAKGFLNEIAAYLFSVLDGVSNL